MKQYITDLLTDTQRELESMKFGNLTLTDRIKYEKAKQKITIIKQLLYKFDIA